MLPVYTSYTRYLSGSFVAQLPTASVAVQLRLISRKGFEIKVSLGALRRYYRDRSGITKMSNLAGKLCLQQTIK